MMPGLDELLLQGKPSKRFHPPIRLGMTLLTKDLPIGNKLQHTTLRGCAGSIDNDHQGISGIVQMPAMGRSSREKVIDDHKFIGMRTGIDLRATNFPNHVANLIVIVERPEDRRFVDNF